MKFNYEKLEITPKIHDYIQSVYQIVDKFPEHEKFGLKSQARRSSTSVLLNLAEGSARSSKAEFARFLKIAIGSLVETDAILKLSVSLGYIDDKQLEGLNPLIQEIFYKLLALKKSQSK